MNNLILIVVVIAVLALLLQNKTEGYSTVGNNVYNPYGKIPDYYLPRTYSHQPYPNNISKAHKYPYDYKPLPYYKRYVQYNPQFYKYGYGHY